jgi:hypothetical protein
VTTTAASRHDVINGVRVLTAVRASLPVPGQHGPPGDRWVPRVRGEAHESRQPNDRRHADGDPRGTDQPGLFVFGDGLSPTNEEQYDRATIRNELQGLVGCVEEEHAPHEAKPYRRADRARRDQRAASATS